MENIPLTKTPTSREIALEIASHMRRIRHLQSLKQVVKKIESESLDLLDPERCQKGTTCSQ